MKESTLSTVTELSVITLIKELDVTDLAGEKVMIDFSTGKYFLLQGVANDIWDYLQAPITIRDITDRLLEQYEVDEETCYNSVVQFIKQLYENKFLAID